MMVSLESIASCDLEVGLYSKLKPEAQISGEHLQDHWLSGLMEVLP